MVTIDDLYPAITNAIDYARRQELAGKLNAAACAWEDVGELGANIKAILPDGSPEWRIADHGIHLAAASVARCRNRLRRMS